MGMINAGIESIARERASAMAKVEKIYSEVTESVVDDLVEVASAGVYTEAADEISTEDLETLLNELPEDAEEEKEEIVRILACDDDDIDIDDIVGIAMNAE